MKSLKMFSQFDLAKLSEDDLKQHCLEVRSNINKNKRINEDTKKLKIYFCYVLRELENRNFVQSSKK